MNNGSCRTTIDETILRTSISCKNNREPAKVCHAVLKPRIGERYHNLQEMSLMDLEYDGLSYPTADELSDG